MASVKTKTKTKRGNANKKTKKSATEDEGDIFSAQGGAPLLAAAALGSDRSTKRQSLTDFTWADFDRYVHQLAAAAKKRFKPTAVVGLAHGGVFVGGAVASALRLEFYPVRLSKRSRDAGKQAAAKTLPRELKGHVVLLVDDVAGSGDSLHLAIRLTEAAGAKKVATACIARRPDGFEPDLCGFTSPDFVVFPWDYDSVAGDSRFEPRTR
jgi:uncharacterized protein